MFVTLFYTVLDPLTGTLTYCNAGHPPPFLARAGEGRVHEMGLHSLDRTGMAMGVVEDTDWEQRTVSMEAGDVLVLYSDGITEAHNAQNELFGEPRLIQAIEDCVLKAGGTADTGTGSLSAQAILDAILDRVRAFVGDAPQSDDLLLMVVMRT
jgi:sigma-B regulation protein RsbU (phosphoserine phosphatase)